MFSRHKCKMRKHCSHRKAVSLSMVNGQQSQLMHAGVLAIHLKRTSIVLVAIHHLAFIEFTHCYDCEIAEVSRADME